MTTTTGLRFSALAASLVIVLGASSPAWATFKSGYQLLQQCSLTENDPNYISDMMYCVGYIAGVADNFDCTLSVGGVFRWQYRNGVSNGQLAKVVVKFLNDHPDRLDLPAASLVTAALADAFPCD